MVHVIIANVRDQAESPREIKRDALYSHHTMIRWIQSFGVKGRDAVHLRRDRCTYLNWTRVTLAVDAINIPALSLLRSVIAWRNNAQPYVSVINQPSHMLFNNANIPAERVSHGGRHPYKNMAQE